MSSDPRSSAWLRRVIGMSLAAALVVVAVVVAVFGPDPSRSPSRAESSPNPASSLPTSPPVSSLSTSPPTSKRPSAVPAAARTGPGLTKPGILMQFSPRDDGGFDVAEHVIFNAGVSRVRFTPPSGRAAGAAFSRTHAEVVDLQVQGDDQQPLGQLASGTITKATSVRLGRTTSTLTLRYRLTGTSIRSMPSGARHALAYLRPITAGIDTTLSIRIVAAGAGISNLTCPGLAAAERACAAGTAPDLRVRSDLRAEDSTVVVQLDLPEP